MKLFLSKGGHIVTSYSHMTVCLLSQRQLWSPFSHVGYLSRAVGVHMD
mgnify:CR=1 FL=1